ncbi:hypothetical protein MNAN1_001569 [Malassezia nana]|uniref:MMS19 nucleotide excision repair protein n=1 Tax=Malassezia nana TaxID=180528 RepID=A0AAF0J202_9BASI|nr:hypothetical protein MNAN1_001569 [Malassezia nana]
MTQRPSDAIRAYMDGGVDLPSSICDDVTNGTCTLLTLVRELGEFLTSDSDTERARAVALLSGVVQHLAAQRTHPQLTRQALRTMTQFFCDKLADAVAIGDARARARNDTAAPVPASAARAAMDAEEAAAMQADAMLVDTLSALHALSGVGFEGNERVASDAFGAEEARTLSAALFTLELRRYPQPLRLLVCRILDSLVARHRDALRSMRVDADAPPGSGFVHGYTTLVQGEKDPRNLLVLFGLVRVLLLEWPIGPREADAFFQVLFCYFPIAFRVPPEDPYGITPDDLKSALRAALSASPSLAPLGMPVFLEKMGASGGAARLDTLRTLTACLPVYGAAAAAAHARALWDYLQLDLRQPPDEETAVCAQDTLTTLLRVLYAEAPLDALADDILRTALTEMREPGKSLARLSMRIVHSYVRANARTAQLATDRLLAQLLGAQLPHTEASDMPALLALLTGLLAELARTPHCDTAWLVSAHDTLLAAFTSDAAQQCEAGIHGLVTLAQLPGLLQPDEVAYAARCVQTALLAPDGALTAPALTALEALLAAYPSVLEAETMPALLHALPSSLAAPSPAVRIVLGALARLGTPPRLFRALAARVLDLLDGLAAADDAVSIGYACALLATLHVALERQQAADDLTQATAAPLARQLLAWLMRPSPLVARARVAQQASDLVSLLSPHLGDETSTLLSDAVRGWDGPTSPLAGTPQAAPATLLAPWAALVAACPTIELPGGGDAWLDALLAWLATHYDATAPGAELAAHSAGLFVCALANKVCAPRASALDAFWAQIPTLGAAQRACLEAWVWMARGWLARGEAHGQAMLTTLRQAMLNDVPRLGTTAASALHVLVRDDALLTRAHGFRVRVLYKQRLLDTLVPQLIDSHAAAKDEAQRAVSLVALAALLPALPVGSLRGPYAALVPLLVETLRLPQGRARASAAQALLAVVETGDAECLPLDTLVMHLLTSVPPSVAAPPATRRATFRLLEALVPYVSADAQRLATLQRPVVQALGQPGQGVDDPRRDVRAAAVDCRDVWYRAAAPT